MAINLATKYSDEIASALAAVPLLKAKPRQLLI